MDVGDYNGRSLSTRLRLDTLDVGWILDLVYYIRIAHYLCGSWDSCFIIITTIATMVHWKLVTLVTAE